MHMQSLTNTVLREAKTVSKTIWLKVWACVLMLAFTAGTVSFPVAAMAQSSTTTSGQPTVKRKNFAQRHTTMTGITGGVAAYKIAKKTGNNRAMAGRKKNFAQRHPIMTGIAAGVVTRKIAKDSGKNKK